MLAEKERTIAELRETNEVRANMRGSKGGLGPGAAQCSVRPARSCATCRALAVVTGAGWQDVGRVCQELRPQPPCSTSQAMHIEALCAPCGTGLPCRTHPNAPPMPRHATSTPPPMCQILEAKVRKLEQLVKLKDAKVGALVAKLQAAGLA